MLTFLKFFFTLFTIVLIPVYWKQYGPQNFLWISDVSLFITVLALWFESRLLMSIVTIGMLLSELLWNLDFIIMLITGNSLVGLSSYMFDPQYSIFLQSLSLFHVLLPIIWVWYIYSWGYNPRALPYAIALIWAVFLLTYFFTNPQENINLIFSRQVYSIAWLTEPLWLLMLLALYPLCVILPVHIMLNRLQKAHPRKSIFFSAHNNHFF